MWAQNVQLSADEHGPSIAAFTLRRDPRVPWGDLVAATQMMVEVDGVLVWGGRIAMTPGQDPDSISVQGQGWQYHLDDDQYDGMVCVSDTTAWRDSRQCTEWSSATMGYFPNVGTVSATNTPGGGSTVQFGWAKGDQVAVGMGVGVSLDFGPSPDRWVGGAGIVFDRVHGGQSDILLYLRGSDSDRAITGAGEVDTFAAITTYPADRAVIFWSSVTRKRYLHFFLWTGAYSGSLATDVTVRIRHSGVHVDWGSIYGIFPAGTYVQDTSKITDTFASQVVKWALRGTIPPYYVLGPGPRAPLLRLDDAEIGTGIDATALSIASFNPDGPRTPRELIEAANAYHDYLYGVTPERRPYFHQRPSTPAYEAGAGSGGPVSDASLNSLEGLYNQVVVVGRLYDGKPLVVTRTATNSLLTRQGFTRTKRLEVQSRMTTQQAQAIGDAWLARKAVGGLRGGATYGVGGIRSAATSVTVHPAHMLFAPGQRLRLTDRVDPITGQSHREGVIRSVSYDHDGETCGLELDNDSASFEALLNRLAAVNP